MRELEQRAEALAVKWGNGYCTDVALELASLPASQAAAVAVLLAMRIRLRPSGSDARALAHLLALEAGR